MLYLITFLVVSTHLENKKFLTAEDANESMAIAREPIIPIKRESVEPERGEAMNDSLSQGNPLSIEFCKT